MLGGPGSGRDDMAKAHPTAEQQTETGGLMKQFVRRSA